MNSLQTLQAQPIIPYNVLANPLSGNTDAQPGSLDDLIESLKEAWIEFQKTGSDKLLQTVLQNGFSAASGGSFNYLALLQAGIGIMGTMLGAEIPGVAVVAPILSMILNWIWPHKKADDAQQLIKLIDAEIQKQLNQALSEQDINNWTGYLKEDFMNAAHAVARAVKNAQFIGTEDTGYTGTKIPKDTDYTTVETVLLATTGAFYTGLSQMLNGNFDTAAFPFFVIGATMQLATYQSFIQFANKWIDVIWPDNQDPKSNGYTHYQTLTDAKADMRRLIRDNTATVLKAFQGGMPSLGSNKYAINDYNVYVRGMVLNGLDMVATWPSMYPDDYISQTKLEQTRVIFSDMVGQDQTSDGNVTIKNILDGNSLTQHGSIDFSAINYFPAELTGGKRSYAPTKNSCYPYGIELDYTLANGTNASYQYSDYAGITDWCYNTFGAPMNVITAQSQSTRYVHAALISFDTITGDGACNGNLNGDSCNMPGAPNCSPCPPGRTCTNGSSWTTSCNQPLPWQKVNVLYPFTQPQVDINKGSLGLIASYVPYDLSPNNVFGEVDSDSENIIGKGLPAEKGYWSNGGDRPIPSSNIAKEWVNGANAVKVEYGAFLAMKATNLTTGPYYIRVRYANPSNKDVNMWQEIWAGNQKLQGGGWTFKSTSDDNVADNFPQQVYVKGQQGNYVIQDITWPTGGNQGDPLNLPSGEIMVKLSGQNSGDSIYVDRIEFIPVSVHYDIKYTITPNHPIFNCGDPDAPLTIWQSKTSPVSEATINISNISYNLPLQFFGQTDNTWTPLKAGGNQNLSNGGPYQLRTDGNIPFSQIAVCTTADYQISAGYITGVVK